MYTVTPINYRARRERTLDLINGSAMLIISTPEALRSSDTEHPYRQESFLHYLSGVEEPETALLFISQPSGAGRKVCAFVRRRDPEAELWTGKRMGVENAVKVLGVDEAYAFDELWQVLPGLIKGVDRLYYSFGRWQEADLHVVSSLKKERKLRGRSSVASFVPVYDSDQISGQLRLVKAPEELERMRIAAQISKRAYDVVFATVRPGMNERQVHGILVGEFMKNGAEMEAYTSIVAGGANACCLHYHANNCDLKDGSLLLIDAGSQFQYYASDVTRTFPIGKRFTAEQRAVYDVVLDVQKKGIDLARKGNTMQQIHESTCKEISKGLVDLGLLKGSADEIFDKKLFKKYFPHGTGHWLGMDVHDVGDYVQGTDPLPLKPGMVFTVEPGIYIEPSDQSVAEGFRGIGIRIEDDVVVTTQEAEVLSAGIPKEPGELENRN